MSAPGKKVEEALYDRDAVDADLRCLVSHCKSSINSSLSATDRWKQVVHTAEAGRIQSLCRDSFILDDCPEIILRAGLLMESTLRDAAKSLRAIDLILQHLPSTTRKWQHHALLDGLCILGADDIPLPSMDTASWTSHRLVRRQAPGINGTPIRDPAFVHEVADFIDERWFLELSASKEEPRDPFHLYSFDDRRDDARRRAQFTLFPPNRLTESGARIPGL